MDVKFRKLSSLAKVFLNEEPAENYINGQVFKNEAFSFQLGFYIGQALTLEDMFIKVSASPENAVQIFEVRNVPVLMPCYPDADADYLRREPGLYPDLLSPFSGSLRAIGMQWRAFWFEVSPQALEGGENKVTVEFSVCDKNGEIQFEKTLDFDFTVLAYELPLQRLICTEWFHYDCIADYYALNTTAPEFLNRVWQYVDFAVLHGMNMLLVPLVTPPLDTLPGQERTTMQLVDIEKNDNGYLFSFERLKSFLITAKEHGITGFEMTPLFTQWGAEHAPKIMASVNGVQTRIFGWETKSDGEEYSEFLKQLLTQLAQNLTEWGMRDICWFHVSDEPQQESHYIHYKKAYTIMASCLEGFKIMDTISSAEFFKEGYIKYPIAAIDHFDALEKAGAHDMWAYYCCAQYKKVQNHFIAMPSRRTRIFGAALYRKNAWGFLQWGYNHWNGKYSERRLNPYTDTDCGGVFPAGDPFLVYPSENGPVSSIRHKVLREAIYDNRAMQLLETLCGRQAVCDIIDQSGEVSFTNYPRTEPQVLGLRARVNKEIINKLALY